MSVMDRLAFFSAKGMAKAGAIVNFLGNVAASAMDTIRAKGLIPLDDEKASVDRTKADAPSLSVDELAAVTVPKFTRI